MLTVFYFVCFYVIEFSVALQNHGLIAINEHVIIDYFVDRFAKYVFLDVPTRLCHIRGTEIVIDRNHILLDDWSFI